eukprot:gene6692-9177_t
MIGYGNSVVALVILLITLPFTNGIWTYFDLIRPRIGAWGSSYKTPYVKISGLNTAGLNTTTGSKFGYSVANIGDIDGNGVDDIAVGAIGESYYHNSTFLQNAGSVYILYMNKNGSVLHHVEINAAKNNGPPLLSGDNFGYSVVGMGDLDYDGVNDIAVGAPGLILSSVYILYMNINGTVKNHTLIRGPYEYSGKDNKSSSVTYAYNPNGPPISYQSRFGVSLANIGDFDHDGVVDLAVGSADTQDISAVYLLYLESNGTVRNYTTIQPNGVGGGPIVTPNFIKFGSSIVLVGDVNNDSVPDIAIGASDYQDFGSLQKKAGGVFICLMNATGHAYKVSRISETAATKRGYPLPIFEKDYCGTSLASIGDINLDQMRQHRPTILHPSHRQSIPDIIMGCPQSGTGSGNGELLNYRILPSETDAYPIGPLLKPLDLFGHSMAGFQDLDENGLNEVLVGAPGDRDNGIQSGAVYILFLRRRRFHPPVPDFIRYVLILTLPPFFCCLLSCGGILYFLWVFRRKPDPIEKIVKDSGLEINPNRKRPKYEFKSKIATIDYTL